MRWVRTCACMYTAHAGSAQRTARTMPSKSTRAAVTSAQTSIGRRGGDGGGGGGDAPPRRARSSCQIRARLSTRRSCSVASARRRRTACRRFRMSRAMQSASSSHDDCGSSALNGPRDAASHATGVPCSVHGRVSTSSPPAATCTRAYTQGEPCAHCTAAGLRQGCSHGCAPQSRHCHSCQQRGRRG